MAHYDDVYLPDGIETGAVYGPQFITEIGEQQSGHEFRNAAVPDSRRVGELSFAPRLEDEYPELLEVFLTAAGRAHSFRFLDLSDYVCSVAQGLVRAITADSGQLMKQYGSGSHIHLRDIQQPSENGFALYSDSGATLLVRDTDYTFDPLGIVTWIGEGPAPDATTLRWSGTFYNAVRFDTDRMATSFAAARVFQWGSIPIKEVLLP